MEAGDMKNLTMVWLSVFVSLCYCYAIGKFVPRGFPRLFGLLPIVCLFLVLPLSISSIHLGGITAFFVAWLANFKLLLFAFGKGPLSSNTSIPLGRFVAIACLPIKVQQNPSPKSQSNGQNGTHSPDRKSHSNGKAKENPVPGKPKIGQKSPLNYATKGLLLAMLVRVHDYTLAQALLGLELEPQFDEPYLSTSLQDFWGRRWNIMVTGILRPAVYEPVLHVATRVMGSRRWASLPAVLSTFVVSALMHELIFYYLGRVMPTWEITEFFLLHGVCLMVEIALKKALAGRFRLPTMISGPLTIGFVMVTGFWLFFPQLLRCKADVRAFEEYAAAGAFFNNAFHGLTWTALNTSGTL
ncbi:hypothetical protein CIPAW_10G077800 [Carya illinoinensis]|uniref:Wax synthase domain-containing protein n=1 Tax=Carya illinoinensis TaxID=32201 RepID=A0A8T1PBP2_CARIL|nr:hypothetical protein CIPAW_10G077800 [Carya illinoinensis]